LTARTECKNHKNSQQKKFQTTQKINVKNPLSENFKISPEEKKLQKMKISLKNVKSEQNFFPI
jgi:hypothetical protein